MLAKRIVACLDVQDGRVVKGVRFKNLRDAGAPADCARRYVREGIDELVMLDVSASLEGRLASLATIGDIAREIDVPLTVGGGVRSVADAIALLDAGADKVTLNSAAVMNPGLLRELSQRYGRQCVVLSIDVRAKEDEYELATHSGTLPVTKNALEWASEGERLGAGEVLLTAIDRDGLRSGFDLRLVAAFTASLGIPVIASGGGAHADSFADVLLAGADAALGASVFHDGLLSANQIKRRCIQRGLEIRL
jgi:cyclase